MVNTALVFPAQSLRSARMDRGLAIVVAEFPCALRRAAQAATANRPEEGSR